MNGHAIGAGMTSAATGVLTVRSEAQLELELPGDLEYSDWAAIGRDIAAAANRIMWHLGDWWAYGDQAYGAGAGIRSEASSDRSTRRVVMGLSRLR